jgi:hypothetical protein
MIKDTIKRKKPSFNETYHGYRTFSELLEDAQKEGVLELETDKRSRTYVVTRFGSEMTSPGAPVAGKTRTVRKRRRGTGRRRPAEPGTEAAPVGIASPGPAPLEPDHPAEAPAETRPTPRGEEISDRDIMFSSE